MPDINEARNKKKPCPPGEDCGIKNLPPIIPRLNKKQFHFSLWYFVIAFLLISFVNNYFLNPPQETLDFSEFRAKILSGEIKRVEMGSRYYIGLPYTKAELIENVRKRFGSAATPGKATIYRTVPVPESRIVPLLDSLGISYYARSEQPNRIADLFFTWIAPILVMTLVWRFFYKRMGNLGQGVMAFGQNRAQLIAEGDVKTTFDDVAGADEAKEELLEVVDFLKQPDKYESVGGRIPKGVLLVGPPGTGKTLLARAVAGEAKVPFFRMSGADFVEMFVGVGAARVRDLFRQAREKAPCIIFIDELDAIGKSRMPTAGGNDEREQTLNQLLVEMDGFDSRSGVIILAATNRPEVLDPALLRPGRFDRQVLVDKPDLKGREAILKIHAKGVSLDETVDLNAVARSTAGFAGAELANIVNEAALMAVRQGRSKVIQADFDEAIEKVMAGLKKKNRIINNKERRIVAFHETGHAITAAFTSDADPVRKISIIPRGLGALGYTMQLPSEERFLATEKELLGKIDVLLGGRAAEELVFKEISTGAANDIERATDIATRMVTEYGMSEKYGNMVLRSRRGGMFLGERSGFEREYSEETQKYIDEQVARIISQRYERVKGLLAEKKELLEKIAAILLEKETIEEEEFARLIGLSSQQRIAN